MRNQTVKEYDYIIIGTGPAGCVLANRLSANGDSVLVLEAGPNRNDDPAVQNYNGGSMMQIPKYFWSDTMEQQPHLSRQTMITGTGRLAGGGSSVNGEVFVRPTPYVLAQWEKLAGPQWSAEKVYDRFKRLERFHGSNTQDVHGTEGRLPIRQTFPEGGALLQKLSESLAEVSGCPVVKDYNNPETPIGPYLHLQVFQKPDGKRASASVSFLGADVATKNGEGIQNPGLQILYDTTATRILFNGAKEAVGVAYLQRGFSASATVRKKVIVCAGLRSATLLQQSGIGPRDVLEDAGVEVVHESAKVGRTLMNDAYTSAVFLVNPEDAAGLAGGDIGTYWRSGAFLPSARPGQPKGKRAIQLLFMDIGNSMLQLVILNIDPKSRGSLKIQSSDPLKTISLDEGFLSNPADMEELKAALRVYAKGMADALAAKDPSFRLLSPAPDILADDAKLEAYIRGSFIQNFHDQGALAMSTAPDAAVNGWCEVNGVENLLVADTSVIPYHTDGNPSACSYVIGETLAAHLLGEE